MPRSGSCDLPRGGSCDLPRGGSCDFAPFGRDYWPIGRSRPFVRAALGVLAAPLAPLLATALLAFLVYLGGETTSGSAWSMTRAAAAELFALLYPPLMLGCGVGFATLWALRLRGRRSFALAGAVLGLVGAALVYWIDGALPMVVAIYAVAVGAGAMLALRRIAGLHPPGR